MTAAALINRHCIRRVAISTSYAPRNMRTAFPSAAFPTSCVRRHASDATAAATKSAPSATAMAADEGGGGTSGKIFFPSLCLLTLGLGVWQTQRYFEKVDMVQKREDDLRMEPLSGFDEWQKLKKNATSDNKDMENTTKSYRRPTRR